MVTSSSPPSDTRPWVCVQAGVGGGVCVQSRPLSLTHCQSLSAPCLSVALAALSPVRLGSTLQCQPLLPVLQWPGSKTSQARLSPCRGVPGWRLVNMTGESQARATHHSQHPVGADTAQYAAGTMHTSHLLTIHITFLNSGHLKQ